MDRNKIKKLIRTFLQKNNIMYERVFNNGDGLQFEGLTGNVRPYQLAKVLGKSATVELNGKSLIVGE